MQVDVQYRPGFSLAVVSLARDEKIQVESGAMVSMSPDIEMETNAEGGFLKSIARRMFGGESFWMNTYTGAKDGDEILLAPPLPGDIVAVAKDSHHLIVVSTNPATGSIESVDGNQHWGRITSRKDHKLVEAVAFYSPK